MELHEQSLLERYLPLLRDDLADFEDVTRGMDPADVQRSLSERKQLLDQLAMSGSALLPTLLRLVPELMAKAVGPALGHDDPDRGQRVATAHCIFLNARDLVVRLGPVAKGPLQKLLDEREDPRERALCALYMGIYLELGDSEAGKIVERLERVLTSESHELVRFAAGYAIGCAEPKYLTDAIRQKETEALRSGIARVYPRLPHKSVIDSAWVAFMRLLYEWKGDWPPYPRGDVLTRPLIMTDAPVPLSARGLGIPWDWTDLMTHEERCSWSGTGGLGGNMESSGAETPKWEYLEVWVDDSRDTFARKWEYLKVSADDSQDTFARKGKLNRRRLIRHGPVQLNLDRDIANNGYELLNSKEESPGVYRFFLRRPTGLPPPPWETLEDEW